MQLVSLINLPAGLSDVINSLRAVESQAEGRMDWNLRRKAGSHDLYHFWSHETMNNIDYVENIKEYADLPKDDQKALFLTNYPMFSWLPYVYKCYELGIEGVPLGDGSYLPAKEEDYSHLSPEWEKLYGTVGSRLMNEVVAKMKEIALTKEEYLLLRVVALMTPGGYLSKDSQTTVKAVKAALQSAILQTKKGSAETRLSDMEEILQGLFAIGTLETNELIHLAPPVSQEGMFNPVMHCPN